MRVADLLADHPLRQELSRHLLLVILEGHAGLLADISWNLSGSVILLCTCISASSRGRRRGSTLMFRSLPFCTSRSWSILSRRAFAAYCFTASVSLAAGRCPRCAAAARCLFAVLLQFAARDDVAIHFGGDFLHDPHIGGDGDRQDVAAMSTTNLRIIIRSLHFTSRRQPRVRRFGPLLRHRPSLCLQLLQFRRQEAQNLARAASGRPVAAAIRLPE